MEAALEGDSLDEKRTGAGDSQLGRSLGDNLPTKWEQGHDPEHVVLGHAHPATARTGNYRPTGMM